MNVTTIEKPSYCFPVALEPIFTKDGVEITRNKAVVRKDSNQAVSVVGSGYNLIPHESVFKAVRPFLEKIGNYTENYSLNRHGAEVTTTFDFKNTGEKMRSVGDFVGLRIIASNTYDRAGRFTIRVGGLVLKCLNGMTSLTETLNVTYCHSGKEQKDISLPSPEETIHHFKNSMKFWDTLPGIDVRKDDVEEITERVKELAVLSDRSLDNEKVKDQIIKSHNAWDLYNAFTYGITHTLKTNSIAARVHRTDMLNQVFSEKFAA